jgi:hypothetical protein
MKFMIKWGLLLIPALALAMPASAQVRPGTLSDSQEPGSVIVFPKFVKGTVTLPEGGTAPATEIEIGVVCPKGAICAEHQAVKIRLHWVCPGSQDPFFKYVCKETDFDINLTVFEKAVIVPDGSFAGYSTKFVPIAECPRGYLIGWVIRPSDDRPIKFDGLIGDAVLRGTGNAIAGTALAAYSAIPIQADPALANTALVTTNGNGALLFDGLAGHYQMVTGTVFGDVRYTSTTAPLSDGSLTLLTLDVKSNRPNNPLFVDLDFFGGFGSVIGNENQVSTFAEFICWTEVRLVDIDANLNTTQMGRKGVFVSGPAAKEQIFGITDTSGPSTLLGLFETTEGPAASPRAYFSNLYNDSVPIPTRFRPGTSPIFF